MRRCQPRGRSRWPPWRWPRRRWPGCGGASSAANPCTQACRLAGYEAARLRRGVVRIEAQVREALEQPRDRGVRLEACEVHPDADVRAVGEREMLLRVGALDVVLVGLGERRRGAVRGGDRGRGEVTLFVLPPAIFDVAGRVAVDGRGGRL